jgi:hypothetical protein
MRRPTRTEEVALHKVVGGVIPSEGVLSVDGVIFFTSETFERWLKQVNAAAKKAWPGEDLG